jgi:transcriptional regulator with XRE-family HTH domain
MIKITKPKHPRKQHYVSAWREYRGLTQDQLAGRVDMSRENLSKIESGKVPYRQDFLEKCAVALNTSTGDLIAVNPFIESAVDKLRRMLSAAPLDDQIEILKYAEFRLKNKQ